jgi:hypothetical protein
MKYQNLRYGNPAELEHQARGIPLKVLAKMLRRSERSVRDWMAGEKKMPWWVPEVLRLRNIEWEDYRRLAGMKPAYLHLGMRGLVIYFPLKSVRAFRSDIDVELAAAPAVVVPPKLRQTKKKARVSEDADLNQWRRWKVA